MAGCIAISMVSEVRAVRFDLFCLLLYAHCLLVLCTSQSAAENVTDHPPECVSLPEDLCPPRQGLCPCVSTPLKSNATELDVTTSSPRLGILCCHLADAMQLRSGLHCLSPPVSLDDGPVALHVRNSSLYGWDGGAPTIMLSSLTVTHSAIPLDDLAKGALSAVASSISCLNLSSNGMGDLPDKALTGLTQLTALDLSHNNITRLPDLPQRVNGSQQSLWIHISSNEGLLCTAIKQAMSRNVFPVDVLSPAMPSNASSTDLEEQPPISSGPAEPPAASVHPPLHFHNKKNTYCTTPQDLWFHWAVRINLEEIVYTIKLDCPSGPNYRCNCSTSRYEDSEISVAVDCSGRGLSELPSELPKHTTSLNVSNNKITSLENLGRNKNYSKIRDFYAENNRITSIEVLEGSDFMHNFHILFLRGNELKELPMYIMKGIFGSSSTSVPHLKLGRNNYHCDCNTYHDLKDWILENKKQILDSEEMLCSDPEQAHIRIIDLQKEKVCLQKTDWKDYLHFIVLVEVLLLVGLVTKVSYDYWIFKTKGYLPWPASRTPKLPCCDWAFDA